MDLGSSVSWIPDHFRIMAQVCIHHTYSACRAVTVTASFGWRNDTHTQYQPHSSPGFSPPPSLGSRRAASPGLSELSHRRMSTSSWNTFRLRGRLFSSSALCRPAVLEIRTVVSRSLSGASDQGLVRPDGEARNNDSLGGSNRYLTGVFTDNVK